MFKINQVFHRYNTERIRLLTSKSTEQSNSWEAESSLDA
jgi:hypothetical protein